MGYDVEDSVEAGDSQPEAASQKPYVISEDCGKGRKQKVRRFSQKAMSAGVLRPVP